MPFDAELVTDRICELARVYLFHHFSRYAPWVTEDRSEATESLSTLGYALHATKTGLQVAGRVWRMTYAQLKSRFYHSEVQKIYEILQTVESLSDPDACDTWISLMIDLGNDAHNSGESQEFRELLHALRCIILENVQADNGELKDRLEHKAQTLLFKIENATARIDKQHNADEDPDIIKANEQSRLKLMRELCWIGKKSCLLKDTAIIQAMCPPADSRLMSTKGTYRYFAGTDTEGHGLKSSAYPIVLATGERGFYCYYARELGMKPDHNHKATYHGEDEYIVCDAPAYEDIPEEEQKEEHLNNFGLFSPQSKSAAMCQLAVNSDSDEENDGVLSKIPLV